MKTSGSPHSKRWIKIGITLVLWLIAAWLLYPLMALNSVNLINAKEYLYRSVAGLAIMIIFLGKTATDLLFPLEISQKKSILYTVFLTIYAMAIAGGIIFMILRMVLVYLQKSDTGSPQL
jgi:hypothetical protein